MTVRVFVIGSLVAAIVGGGAWALVVTSLDPSAAGSLGYVLFFLSLFVTVASVAGLVGYGIRRILMPGLLATYLVRTSLRQGVMVSLLVSLLLLLQLIRLYRWWVALVIVVLLVSFELVFVSYDRVNARGSRKAAQ